MHNNPTNNKKKKRKKKKNKLKTKKKQEVPMSTSVLATQRTGQKNKQTESHPHNNNTNTYPNSTSSIFEQLRHQPGWLLGGHVHLARFLCFFLFLLGSSILPSKDWSSFVCLCKQTKEKKITLSSPLFSHRCPSNLMIPMLCFLVLLFVQANVHAVGWE